MESVRRRDARVRGRHHSGRARFRAGDARRRGSSRRRRRRKSRRRRKGARSSSTRSPSPRRSAPRTCRRSRSRSPRCSVRTSASSWPGGWRSSRKGQGRTVRWLRPWRAMCRARQPCRASWDLLSVRNFPSTRPSRSNGEISYCKPEHPGRRDGRARSNCSCIAPSPMSCSRSRGRTLARRAARASKRFGQALWGRNRHEQRPSEPSATPRAGSLSRENFSPTTGTPSWSVRPRSRLRPLRPRSRLRPLRFRPAPGVPRHRGQVHRRPARMLGLRGRRARCRRRRGRLRRCAAR